MRWPWGREKMRLSQEEKEVLKTVNLLSQEEKDLVISLGITDVLYAENKLQMQKNPKYKENN